MSLILEALRRSETERQRAQLPGLLLSPPPPRRRRRPLRLAIVASAVLALGAVGWWFEWQDRLEFESWTAPARTGAARTPTRTPTGSAATPTPPDPSARALPISAAILAPTVSPPAAPASVPDSIEVIPMDRPPQPATPDSSMGQAKLPAQPQAHALESTAEPGVQANFATAPGAALDPALPPLDSLSAEQRAGLPPLKLSVHFYSLKAGQRWVMLDGRRYQEGDLVDGRIEISAIRRDGVALRVDGRELLLARP